MHYEIGVKFGIFIALFELHTDGDISQGMFKKSSMSLQAMINILTINNVKLFSPSV